MSKFRRVSPNSIFIAKNRMHLIKHDAHLREVSKRPWLSIDGVQSELKELKAQKEEVNSIGLRVAYVKSCIMGCVISSCISILVVAL